MSWPKLKQYVEADAERQEVEKLFELIRAGDLDGVRHTLDDDPTLIDGMTGWGMTPLYCAVRSGKPEAVALLLDRGADPNVRQGAALFDCNNLDSLHLMLERGGVATVQRDDHRAHGLSLIHAASFRGDPAMLRLVLAHGGGEHLDARLTQGNEGRYAGYTPLQVAAKLGKREFAEELVRLGARRDLFSAACLGDLPWMRTALAGDPGLIEAVDHYGSTAALLGHRGKPA